MCGECVYRIHLCVVVGQCQDKFYTSLERCEYMYLAPQVRCDQT